MNRRAALVATALLLCAPSHVRAAGLSPEEQSYVLIALNTMSVSHLCGYNVVKGSLTKLGDQTGVDDKIGAATFEALKVDTGEDYNRTLLIPEVTRFVHGTVDAMIEATKNKALYCKTMVPVLLDRGTIER